MLALSSAVMTVPQRLDAARGVFVELLEQSAALLRVDVLLYDPVFCIDAHLRGTRFGASQAWGAVAQHATHHLVVQDDAILANGFLGRVLEAIEEQPEALLSFQLAKGLNAPQGTPLPAFLRTSQCYGALALAMPATQARKASRFLAHAHVGHDDEALAQFARAEELPLLVAVPSLVQHGELPSTVGHDSIRERLVAEHFLDDLPLAARRFRWGDAPVIDLR